MHKTIVSILILAVLVTGASLRLSNLNNTFVRTVDETTYTNQATQIAEYGYESIKILIRQYNANPGLWIYPAPIRIGYIVPVAAVMKATNAFGNVKIGAYFSCAFSIIGLLILVVTGLRFFNPYITLFGLIFLSVSPMDLTIARRAWQDAMLGTLAALLIYITCEITRSKRNVLWYTLFVLLGSYCILIKESGTAIYALCILWALSVLFMKKRFMPDGVFLIVACAAGAAISITVLAYSVGGFSIILETLKHHIASIPYNKYAAAYQSGPWYNLLLGLWVLNPVNFCLCIVGIAVTLFRGAFGRKETGVKNYYNRPAVLGMIFFMLTFLILTILAPHCQNLRYLSVLYGLFYLMAGLGLWQLLLSCKGMKNKAYLFIISALICGAIIITALSDYHTFKKLLAKTDMFDLAVN